MNKQRASRRVGSEFYPWDRLATLQHKAFTLCLVHISSRCGGCRHHPLDDICEVFFASSKSKKWAIVESWPGRNLGMFALIPPWNLIASTLLSHLTMYYILSQENSPSAVGRVKIKVMKIVRFLWNLTFSYRMRNIKSCSWLETPINYWN